MPAGGREAVKAMQAAYCLRTAASGTEAGRAIERSTNRAILRVGHNELARATKPLKVCRASSPAVFSSCQKTRLVTSQLSPNRPLALHIPPPFSPPGLPSRLRSISCRLRRPRRVRVWPWTTRLHVAAGGLGFVADVRLLGGMSLCLSGCELRRREHDRNCH
jgi:hypothetical protein